MLYEVITGMSKYDIDNLFKIDKVLSKPGTDKETGSGLGLILCKEFVEKHTGKIWVVSKPDIGSEFIGNAPFGGAAGRAEDVSYNFV